MKKITKKEKCNTNFFEYVLNLPYVPHHYFNISNYLNLPYLADCRSKFNLMFLKSLYITKFIFHIYFLSLSFMYLILIHVCSFLFYYCHCYCLNNEPLKCQKSFIFYCIIYICVLMDLCLKKQIVFM